jgi:hypothetical protein
MFQIIDEVYILRNASIACFGHCLKLKLYSVNSATSDRQVKITKFSHELLVYISLTKFNKTPLSDLINAAVNAFLFTS